MIKKILAYHKENGIGQMVMMFECCQMVELYLGIDLFSFINKTHDADRVFKNFCRQPGDCFNHPADRQLKTFGGELIPKNIEPHCVMLLDGRL